MKQVIYNKTNVEKCKSNLDTIFLFIELLWNMFLYCSWILPISLLIDDYTGKGDIVAIALVGASLYVGLLSIREDINNNKKEN